MITNKKIKVLAAWDTPNYTSLNGFHPLFSWMCVESSVLDFQYLSRENLAAALRQGDCIDAVASIEIDTPQPNNTREEQEFWGFFDWTEVCVSETVQSDVYFSHTVPLVTTNKPFIFHIENVNSLFIPWGAKPFSLSKRKRDRIWEMYRQIFENDNCLGIVSHYKTTLDNLRKYLGDSVSTKLEKFNLSIASYQTMREKQVISENRPWTFLFTGSMHGCTRNLANRGMGIAEEFISEWIKLYPHDLFVFMCAESPSAFDSSKIPEGTILYLGNRFFSSNEFEELLGMSDFFFLPSVTIHTASIISSLAQGVVPIVNDLSAWKELGISEKNSIVLNKGKVFQRTTDQLETEVVNHLNEQNTVAELIDKLIKIKDDSQKLVNLKSACLTTCEQEFNVLRTHKQLAELIRKRFNLLGAVSIKKSKMSEYLTSSTIGTKVFDKRSVFRPFLDLGEVKIHSDGQYFAVAHRNAILTEHHYSPLFKGSNLIKIHRFRSFFKQTQLFGKALDVAFQHAFIGIAGLSTRDNVLSNFSNGVAYSGNMSRLRLIARFKFLQPMKSRILNSPKLRQLILPPYIKLLQMLQKFGI